MTEKRLATPQWSVILPWRTRMASTVSNWMVLPVATRSVGAIDYPPTLLAMPYPHRAYRLHIHNHNPQ
jgi:hypothetical protein